MAPFAEPPEAGEGHAPRLSAMNQAHKRQQLGTRLDAKAGPREGAAEFSPVEAILPRMGEDSSA